MAVIKCKMCGGDLVIEPGATVAECEYCGTKQTIPNQDDEKKLTLFARANRLRMGCEFDKAAGIYESIVADFPQEAEAYWGLVLCKYGIEYVDDPATGKKIPTCHRSSFESIMEDSDFEQALENADVVARKVYREEAKQIEEIRKGIIEVSGKEEPYDIFICYKETDENGQRTVDSVIAQDVYDALTEKGYRVFFSRITLEDKLGQEYEPYIFAALNSAKIMLAFGTDYEYYNAVWVKNEWSRYLKLMAKDKTKHLIPCYKGIDAYDMPKEFAKLQAQDMGKVGAIQDLMRGIEKLLPKAAPVTVVQERVVVGGGGNNKIASLLDRGNMALEDGDWAKADSFFEDVLNNDSKNAQAYLGKALAGEKCRTLDALVRKRKDATQKIQGEKLKLAADEAHISEMVQKYSLPGYVSQDEIRRLYTFDLSYYSEVPGRKRQYENTEHYWTEHKQLSRAEKFAVGPVAENLAQEKKALFSTLSFRVKSAEQAEKLAKKDLQARYEAHLRQAAGEAEKRYRGGCARREADYQKWVKTAQSSADVEELTEAAQGLEGLGAYSDSAAMAGRCRQRAAEEQAKQKAEAERRRKTQEAADKARAAKNKKIDIFTAAVAVIAIAIFIVLTQVVIPGNNYKKAEALLANGQYDAAIEAFEALGNYKDSQDRISEGTYKKAQYLCETGDKVHAAMLFGGLGNLEDAKERSTELWNDIASRDMISTGGSHTVGLRADGTVVAVGWNALDQCDVSDWTDIVAISAGSEHTVGLKADGTVVAVGSSSGQCNVSDWTDIVAVSAGEHHTVGLKANGTVVAAGYPVLNQYGQCDVSDWTDIVAVSAGELHTVGLKADGTVVAVGKNSFGQCDVSDWTDIVAISAGSEHTVGLKADGTVVTVGRDYEGLRDVSEWENIVAVSAGGFHTVGLKADGTVVMAGKDNLPEWKDIVAVTAGVKLTVALKADGTVVAIGKNDYGQCNVSGWSGIKLPNK